MYTTKTKKNSTSPQSSKPFFAPAIFRQKEAGEVFPGGPNTPFTQPGSTYSNCSREQEKAIKTSVNRARNLVNNAINRLNQGVAVGYSTHFGSAPMQVVEARYRNISRDLGNKKFICSDCTNEDKEALVKEEIPSGQLLDPTHICGMGQCPGNTIVLCPDFFSSVKKENESKKKNKKPRAPLNLPCPPAATIIHEAAHNDGACGDIEPVPPNYPPPNAENNAYSYEMYAAKP